LTDTTDSSRTVIVRRLLSLANDVLQVEQATEDAVNFWCHSESKGFLRSECGRKGIPHPGHSCQTPISLEEFSWECGPGADRLQGIQKILATKLSIDLASFLRVGWHNRFGLTPVSCH
jgi:hypothetical protein